MRSFLAVIPFAACALAAALAEPVQSANLTERDSGFKVNYYTDGGCDDYLISMYVKQSHWILIWFKSLRGHPRILGLDGYTDIFGYTRFPFTDDSCYGYQYTGDNSANIANCDAPSGSDCVCTFFVQPNCGGAGQSIGYSSGADCTSNFGRGFLSMRCTYL
ncbi:hypothetical protein F5Y04DRAFT_241078 [Hypomontagnella monticulosa]|nr:hypothetical protein F5Y04DRAFT_241078 [Hypomontagnella monticulosa]